MARLNPLQLIDQASHQIFPGIDAQVKENLRRVLMAFREHKVGNHHFASVSGYGHHDLGRDVLDRVFASVLQAEAAIVRVQFVSGTHAIACALFGALRPGDELLSVSGPPYDTLEEVIGVRGSHQGSLQEFGVRYRQLELTPEGAPDLHQIAAAIGPQTRVVLIQRSCGYSWRSSLTISAIESIVRLIKQQRSDIICFVDNCYGEFVETLEPTAVGADLIAGSLIKNPGGTLATTGGYVAGRADLVEAAACRLTAPGIGSRGGGTLNHTRVMFQGLFLAPQMVGEAMKGNYLISRTFDSLGYAVNPPADAQQREVIQAVRLGSAAKLIAFCKAIQRWSPVESYVEPTPAPMPGYATELVMAGGTFIDGSTSELSADGPLREPYIVYCQGGSHWSHIALALEAAVEAVQAA